MTLSPLLRYLDGAQPSTEGSWSGWRIQPIGGGANNLVFRATNEIADLAVKFTIPDERDRAGREYAALRALRQAGLDLAPQGLLLERHQFRFPVVVQTWIAGQVTPDPPQTASEWKALAHHFIALRAVTSERIKGVEIAPAVLTMESADAGLRHIHLQVQRIPDTACPAHVRDIVRRARAVRWPEWPVPVRTLCRCDPNPRNFIRRPHGWASVDWENSGWGDPAFEVADAMAHPAYVDVPYSSWAGMMTLFGAPQPDPTFEVRAWTYYRLMLVWWVARFARALYEVPRGLDRRLVARPEEWEAETRLTLERYAKRAGSALG